MGNLDLEKPYSSKYGNCLKRIGLTNKQKHEKKKYFDRIRSQEEYFYWMLLWISQM